jgi:pyruvate-ferredoxin/flavodoxin oxidoreductase
MSLRYALGANPMKAIQALKEAESYNGPSLVICYCPCANQGIKGGLTNSIKEEKDAVSLWLLHHIPL